MSGSEKISISNYESNRLSEITTFLESVLPGEGITVETFASRALLDSNFDPEGVFVAKNEASETVGFLLAMRRIPGRSDMAQGVETGVETSDGKGWITLFGVRPDVRRIGVGSQLFNRAEAWLRSRNCKSVLISPYPEGYWMPGADEGKYAVACLFLASRGYKSISRPLSMKIELSETWRASERASEKITSLERQGAIIEPFTPDRAFELTKFLKAEFPGDWEGVLRETMRVLLQHSTHSRILSLAFRNHRIIGFAQSDGSRFGPFGVAKSEQGKGVGVALLFHTLALMRENGETHAWFMWTNDSTAERLYTPAGFRESRRFSIFEKDLNLDQGNLGR